MTSFHLRKFALAVGGLTDKSIIVDASFFNHFTGNKRVRKKRGKKMVKRILREVIIPYAKELTRQD